MTGARIITNDGVREVSDATFFELAFGHPPRVIAAEEEARHAQMRLATLIHDTEYAVARREREALIRRNNVEGTHFDINEPFDRAAERVRQHMTRRTTVVLSDPLKRKCA